MKKALICFICLLMFAGTTTVRAYESSESFSLYTNTAPQADETANELKPEEAPIDGGAFILLSIAGIYAFRVYRKRNKETI